MADEAKDLLGRDLEEAEVRLLEAYRVLRRLAEDVEGLAPAARAGVREALASMWQVVNDLALTDERPPL